MTDSPLSIVIHPSEFPTQVRTAVLAGLKAGRIPGRVLYQSDAQAQRWLDYHRAFSPSRIDSAVREMYRSAFQAGFDLLPDGPCVAISLGCGGGQKDGDLFDTLTPEHRAHSAYVPIDTSVALVVEATLHVAERHPQVPAFPLVANLEAEPDLNACLQDRVSPELPRLLCAFGLLPNLEPLSLLAYVRRLLRPGDALLLSANQSPKGLAGDGERILTQYDNVPARTWYLGAVEALGIPLADVDLRIDTLSVQSDGGWWRIDVKIVPRRDLEIRIHGEAIAWQAGQIVELFHSHRFTVPALTARLESAQLEVLNSWQGAGGEEGILLLRRA
jgi:Histidine-specific methyltransferase, SAM-dependent